jgi:DNA-binding NtrC family response regulator
MLTFLLIENEDEAAQTVQQALLPLGDSYTLKRVKTLHEAKRLLLNPREDVHLGVVSLSLPDSTGIDTLKNLPDYLPVIVLSGSATPAMQIHALDTGVQIFVDKARFDWQTFPDLVTRILYAAKTRKCILCNVDKELAILGTLLRTVQSQISDITKELQRLAEIEGWLFGRRTLDEQIPGAVDILRDVKNYQKWAKIAFGTAITAIIASLATALFS